MLVSGTVYKRVSLSRKDEILIIIVIRPTQLIFQIRTMRTVMVVAINARQA